MKDPDYAYLCEDKSILLPIFKKRLWNPLAERIPERFSANTLSLTGSLCASLAFTSSMMINPAYPILYLLPGFLIFCYLTLDNIDGSHARKTGQSSPLGEFIDHWLDTFNNGLVIWGLGAALQLPHWMILMLLGAVGLAFFGTLWEQRHTGIIQMDMFGNVEGLVLVSLLYLLLALFGIGVMYEWKIFGLLSIAEGVAIWVFLQSMLTSARCFWRTKKGHQQWIPPVLTSCVSIAWFLLGEPGYFAIASILLFANPALTGRHVVSRVLGRSISKKRRNFFVLVFPLLVALSLGLKLQTSTQHLLAWISAGYLALQTLYDFSIAVHSMREHLRPEELLARFFLRGWRERLS